MPHHALQVLVVESDPAVAREVSALIVQSFLPRTTTLLATTSSVQDARELIESYAKSTTRALLVVCAAELADGESGLRVLEIARLRHPRAVGVVITNGEREQFVEAMRRGAASILQRPVALDALTNVLRHLGEQALTQRVEVVDPNLVRGHLADDLRESQSALERALDAVETAQLALRRARGAVHANARADLAHAERLAVEAHRRVLDVRRTIVPGEPR